MDDTGLPILFAYPNKAVAAETSINLATTSFTKTIKAPTFKNKLQQLPKQSLLHLGIFHYIWYPPI